MFPISNPSQINVDNASNSIQPSPSMSTYKTKEIKESECYLSSVRDLRAAVIKGRHSCKSDVPHARYE